MSTPPAPPVRVLQVIAGLDPTAGGPPASAVATSLSLRRRGARGHVVYSVARGRERMAAANAELLRTAGVNVYGFSVTRVSGELGARWGISLHLGTWVLRNARRFDVVHVHGAWTFTTVIGLAAARLRRRVAVLSSHESLTDFDRAKSTPSVRLVKRVLRRAYFRLFDVVVMASALEQRDSGDPDGRNSVVVPHAVPGVEPSLRAEESATLRVGFLGRLHPKKNLGLLLEAFANVDCDAELMVAGDGPRAYVDHLRHLALGLGIADRVTWLRFIDADGKRDFFGSIHVLAMPSDYESFGIAAVEAMRAGIPVIVSPTVGVSDVITRHEAGLVVLPKADVLAAAINTFAADPAFLTSASERARVAAEEFSLDRHGACMHRQYLRLLGDCESTVNASEQEAAASCFPSIPVTMAHEIRGRSSVESMTAGPREVDQ